MNSYAKNKSKNQVGFFDAKRQMMKTKNHKKGVGISLEKRRKVDVSLWIARQERAAQKTECTICDGEVEKRLVDFVGRCPDCQKEGELIWQQAQALSLGEGALGISDDWSKKGRDL